MSTPNDPLACPEYNRLSRRLFLQCAGGAAIAASAPAWLPRVALARDARLSQRDVIVSIYLRGAADGLSMVPPWGESRYYEARPTLAIPRPDSTSSNRAINLDGFFGLAPAMAPLMPAYNDGNLLFVHACGSRDPSRSHFEAQAFMETGEPGNLLVSTGWLGRHLASVSPAVAGAPLRGVGLSHGLQLTLAGGPRTLPIPSLANFDLAGSASTMSARRAALGDMYASEPDPLGAAGINTLQTIDLLNAIDFAGYQPVAGVAYPAGSFGVALKSAAALIKAQVGVEAIALDLGGWDTHISQGSTSGALATLMGTLASGLAAFYTDVIASNAPSTTVVCMSEFGRRLVENGSRGTDHGHGNVMTIMGKCVAGGRVDAIWPGLATEQLFERRDLEVTTDYRDVLAEIIRDRLGNSNLSAVFPNFTPTPVGVLRC